MNRSALNFVIDEFIKKIDHWHEFRFSDAQIMTTAQDFQKFDQEVLLNVLDQVKTAERKPSLAQLNNLCTAELKKINDQKILESRNDVERENDWMTPKEYANTQGFDSLRELIRSKIEEERTDENSDIDSPLSSSINDLVGDLDG